MNRSNGPRGPYGRVVFPVEPVRRSLTRHVAIVLPLVVAALMGAAFVGHPNDGPALGLTRMTPDSAPIVVEQKSPPPDTTPAPSTPAAPLARPQVVPRRTPPVAVTHAPPPAHAPVKRVDAAPAARAEIAPTRSIELPPPPTLPDVTFPATNDAPGRLFVSVTPWADVTVDGTPAGTSPVINFPLPPGQHRLRVTRAGFDPFERTIVVNPGETVRLTDIVLRRHPS